MMLQSLYTFELRPKALIIDLKHARPVVSSAPLGGGWCESRYLVNHTVDATFSEDVENYLNLEIQRLGLPKEQTTCVMTAVDIHSYSYAQAVQGGVKARVYLTMGLGNLSSPGYSPLATYAPGTINMLVLLQASLPPSAMIETIQIISEAKTRCLQGLLTSEGYLATGTSTDTITVAFLPGDQQSYSGAVTPVGRSLGLAVNQAFQKAFVKQRIQPLESPTSVYSL
jgi:adenosylcobinamide amidohydrolase